METKKKPATKAQAVFGKEFGNAEIITKRPKGMSMLEYRNKRKECNLMIKNSLR